MSESMDFAPILWTQNATGVALLVKAVPKVAGDGRTWEVDFWVDLNAKANADQLSGNFPAVGSYYDAAVNEIAAADLKIKPLAGQNCHVTLKRADGTVVVEDQPAEIRFMKLRANTNVRGQFAKVRLLNCQIDQSNDIVGAIGERVAVNVTQDQGTLFIPTADEPEVGMVVTGVDKAGNTIAGRMTRKDDAGVIVDDFGVLYTLAGVSTAVTVESCDDSTVADLMASYQEAVNSMEDQPSWSRLIEAVGVVWMAGDVIEPTATTVYMNANVVAAAIALHVSDIPEAGTGS